MVQAMVALLPLPGDAQQGLEPVAPAMPSARPSIARGWSPAGEKSLTTLNGGTAHKAYDGRETTRSARRTEGSRLAQIHFAVTVAS